jgi:DNA-binding transcriptional regulator LsrR (DeoR family)
MDNARDRDAKGRGGACRGEANPNAKLTAGTVRAIRAAYASGRTQVSVAAEFGIRQTDVSKLVRRESWKHVV